MTKLKEDSIGKGDLLDFIKTESDFGFEIQTLKN